MVVNKDTINDYKDHGVALLKNVISKDWLEKLAKGIEKNFKNPSQYKCVYEEKDGKEIIVNNGRYGPYIKLGKDYFSLPKEEDPLEISLKNAEKIIYVSVNLASLITIEAKVAKEELEKIILIEIPTRIYPNLRSMVVLLFEKSGYKKINIHEKIDFLKLYEQKKTQK